MSTRFKSVKLVSLAVIALAAQAAQAGNTTTIDLGLNKSFSLVAFGNVADLSDVEGRAAVGGSILNGFDVGYRIPYAEANAKAPLASLYVGGSWNAKGAVIYAGPSKDVPTNASADHSKVGPAAAKNDYAANGATFTLGKVSVSPDKITLESKTDTLSAHASGLSSDQFDFKTAKSQAVALGQQLAGASNSVAVTNGKTLKGDGKSDLVYFNLGSANNLNELQLSQIAKGAHIVITSTAKTVTLQGGNFQTFADRVIFNLPEATSVNMGWGGWGTVLAPNATIFGTGHWEGNAIVNEVAFANSGKPSWKGGATLEIGYEPFKPYGTVTPVPEPETYALMIAGLAAVGFVARRRKKAQ